MKEHYRLVVTALTVSAKIGFAAYEFSTTSPPTMGGLTVSPSEGVSLITKFNIKSSGWLDENMPLLYEIYIQLEQGLENVLVYGNTNFSSVRLPPGNRELRAFVIDSLGEQVEKRINVEVNDGYENGKIPGKTHLFLLVIKSFGLLFGINLHE